MEAMFVILSEPLDIRTETIENKDIYSPVYGFKIDDEGYFSSQDIEDYVGYLAAMDFWSHHPEEECLFKLDHTPNGKVIWVDKDGGEHTDKDYFMIKVSRHYMKELGLTYDFVRTEIADDSCFDGNLIVKDSLYNLLKTMVYAGRPEE